MKCRKCKKGEMLWKKRHLQLVRDDGVVAGTYTCNRCGFNFKDAIKPEEEGKTLFRAKIS